MAPNPIKGRSFVGFAPCPRSPNPSRSSESDNWPRRWRIHGHRPVRDRCRRWRVPRPGPSHSGATHEKQIVRVDRSSARGRRADHGRSVTVSDNPVVRDRRGLLLPSTGPRQHPHQGFLPCAGLESVGPRSCGRSRRLQLAPRCRVRCDRFHTVHSPGRRRRLPCRRQSRCLLCRSSSLARTPTLKRFTQRVGFGEYSRGPMCRSDTVGQGSRRRCCRGFVFPMIECGVDRAVCRFHRVREVAVPPLQSRSGGSESSWIPRADLRDCRHLHRRLVGRQSVPESDYDSVIAVCAVLRGVSHRRQHRRGSAVSGGDRVTGPHGGRAASRTGHRSCRVSKDSGHLDAGNHGALVSHGLGQGP